MGLAKEKVLHNNYTGVCGSAKNDERCMPRTKGQEALGLRKAERS